MTGEDRLRSQVTAWRQAEDSLYASVLQVPALYTACIRLVRATADEMADIEDVEGLLRVFDEGDPDVVASLADNLGIPQREFLDYDLVRGAAFHLRYQEILGAQYSAEVQQKINEARSAGAEWVVLHESKTRVRGHSYVRRLEMHLADGVGLYSGTELDWEKGRVYVVEPISLDPATGQIQRGAPPPGPRQEFTTPQEMAEAADALRAAYSSDTLSPTEDDRHIADGGGPNG